MPGTEALSNRLSGGRTMRALAALALLALIASMVLLDATRSLPSDLLTVLPALALALLMVARPYLAAETIMRLRGAPARRRAKQEPTRAVPRRRRQIVRGGRLIAVALAGRAPPALLPRAL